METHKEFNALHSEKSLEHARLLKMCPRCVRLPDRCRRRPSCSGAFLVSAGPNQPDPNRNASEPGPERTAIFCGISACDMQFRHRRAKGAVNASWSRRRQGWTGRQAVRAPRCRRLRPEPKYRARFEPSLDTAKSGNRHRRTGRVGGPCFDYSETQLRQG
jgi:hypothetical protein